jgi:hypothetical protein
MAFAGVLATQALASNYFVSTTGSPSGDGSITNTLDINTALSQTSPVKPGDTLWIRAGIYEANTPEYCLGLKPTLSGSSNAPVIVRGFPGERAILQQPDYYANGPCISNQAPDLFEVAGNYVWYRDLEIRGTNTTRSINMSGSNPPFYVLPLFNSVGVDAYGIKLINLVVHDTAGGFGVFASATNCESSGCLIYNNGWAGTDRGHGVGIYSQSLTGQMHFDNNIIFDQFSEGIQGYTESSTLKHFLIDHNVVFDNNILTTNTSGEQILFGSGTTPVQDLNLLTNYVYAPLSFQTNPVRLDYGGGSNVNVNVANNYVAAWTATGAGNYLVTATSYQSVVFTNNTLYSPHGPLFITQVMPGNIINDNIYSGDNGLDFNNDINSFTFSGWQSATGYDLQSSYTTNLPPNLVVVNPNPYAAKRANIVVYNWANSNAVNVDVSSVLSTGDVYEVINAQNYFGPPVLTGTYTGGALSLPMTNLTVAVPNGWTNTNAVPDPGAQFNVFILIGNTPPQMTSCSLQTNGSFLIQFTGAASDCNCSVEDSTDLVNWVAIGLPTNSPVGSAFYQYTDPAPAPGRFYRVNAAY